MKPNYSKLRSRATFERLGKRSGFTLIELLTVIAIIGMLSAISITTVRAAIQSAKETQTRTTVAKLDNVLTAAYEKYQYRRFDDSNIVGAMRTPAALAARRVEAIREQLRCDFPCTLSEALDNAPLVGESALQAAYRAEIGLNGVNLAHNADGSLDEIVANAQLLYLVVMNVDPEARDNFTEREIADGNGGLKYFIDGWGNPICWARWAPGLENSDRQPSLNEINSIPVNANGSLDFGQDFSMDSDPFDPLNVYDGWFLVPYVYSAGPDGEYGLVTPFDSDAAFGSLYPNNPFAKVRNPVAVDDIDMIVGAPKDKTYKDNIDNHTLVR